MRITKVKVRNDEVVLMNRTHEKGSLVIGSKYDNVDKTTDILTNQKKDNFKKSLVNKTVRVDRKDKNKYQHIRNTIDNLINKEQVYSLRPINDVEKIKEALTSKFKKEIKYIDESGVKKLNLVDLLNEYSNNNDISKLKPYLDWTQWYVKTRTKYLIKSIEKNKIQTDNISQSSKRKEILKTFEEELKSKGNINIEEFVDTYKLKDLIINSINILVKFINKDEEDRKYRNLNFDIKTVLKQHQKTVFGTREEPKNRDNYKLALLSNEITKYIEHYFPIKGSKRTNDIATIKHCLKESNIKKRIKYQIENAVRLNMLQTGKLNHHNINNDSVNSTILSDKKREEAFVLNLISACAFAANNIRNIIDKNQQNDILGKKDFVESLDETQKTKKDSVLYKSFFGKDLPTEEKEFWALRGSVQQIRNNIIHYKASAINTIFNIEEFEYSNYSNIYNQSQYKEFLEDDIKELQSVFANKLMTSGILTYYDKGYIENVLSKFNFSLSPTSIPFTPSFKKVFNQGWNYQNAQQLSLKHFFKNKAGNEIDSAKYCFLKIIYNDIFLKYFEKKELFKKAVDEVLQNNRPSNENEKSKYKYAFNGINGIKDNESIEQYLSKIQSQMMQEELIKEEKKIKTKEEQRNNFQKFLLQVYIKGFDSFLTDNDCFDSTDLKYQFEEMQTNQDKTDALNNRRDEIKDKIRIDINIDINENKQIAFYTFCKLLDSNHLSTLRNEMIKYNACTNKSSFEIERDNRSVPIKGR